MRVGCRRATSLRCRAANLEIGRVSVGEVWRWHPRSTRDGVLHRVLATSILLLARAVSGLVVSLYTHGRPVADGAQAETFCASPKRRGLRVVQPRIVALRPTRRGPRCVPSNPDRDGARVENRGCLCRSSVCRRHPWREGEPRWSTGPKAPKRQCSQARRGGVNRVTLGRHCRLYGLVTKVIPRLSSGFASDLYERLIVC